jgi:hypothetical protein
MIAASRTTARAGPRTAARQISYRHLADLSDGRGVFEHALHALPRPEHGYCLDDVARALVVVVREPRPTSVMQQLAETYLRFIEQAIDPDGRAHNRMDVTGTFTDDGTMGDWWGRAIAALGFTVAHAQLPAMRIRATRAFLQMSLQRPADVRTAAFAAIGAAEVLKLRPSSAAARGLLERCLEVLPLTPVPGWHWPEERLRYANATLPEAMIAAGDALGDIALVGTGLGYLDFLIDAESRDGHLSVTGTAGRGPEERGPFFDQQPIEVAAIADASARAYALRGDPRWFEGVRRAWGWFVGENDVGVPMIEPETGAGFDGLESAGRNENRGAESTLAAVGTAQHARQLGILGPWASVG